MSKLILGEDRYFIRRMREEDLPAVRAIEALSFSNPWSDNTFRGEIQNTSVSFPMAVVRRPGNPVVADEEVVAYIIYWQILEDVQVNNIAVHPDCRGLGLGEALMRYAIARVLESGATFMTLEVRQSNAPALTLYKKLGFEVMGTRKNYYTKPDEDAFVMALVLG
ncbi:MAG: ribosomal protein S18-alanine N-acetyltransferase [Candidatus Aminicenantes bacterium]|nr:ribosomal protein S18-alanine N-acetyltransferase [Candidatus Aminicenantes bacterium]